MVARWTSFLSRSCLGLSEPVDGSASDEHLAEIRAVYSDDDLRAALQHAQPGIFNLSAWEYWNHALGVDPIPELPRRFISQSESVAADPDCNSFIVCRSR